jgi:hypothetical protein
MGGFQLVFRVGIGRVCGDEVADPSECSAGAYPETGCYDQPEDASPERTVVDLPHSRNKETQDSRSTRVFHRCLS